MVENNGVMIDKDGDFLDEMLMKREINDEEKVSVVMDLLFAGYETTAGLLGLLVYFLAKSPKVVEQLKEEHQALRIKKKDGSQPLTWQDIHQLEFNSHVCNHALIRILAHTHGCYGS